jgi:hypothetical protein
MGMNPRLLRPLASGRFGALRVGLVAYWPFEEDASSGDVTAVDWTGRGNDLTSNNTVPSVTGKVGLAREFVAANSEFLSRNSNTDLQFGDGDWSISLWVQPRATGSVSGAVVGKDTNLAREFSVFCETNTGNNSNRFSVAVFNTSGSLSINPAEPADTSNAAFVNTWFHVVVVNSGGVVTLYRDGVSRASATRPGGQVFNTTSTPFNIGRRSFPGAESHFTGYVDEVAKWTRALSAAEISTLYNNGNGIDLRR